MSERELVDRWPLPLGTEVAERLLAAWGSADRSYHDLTHLGEVLDRLDELSDAGTEFDVTAVGLAAWFHDAVYDAGPEPEARSAQLARAELAALGTATALVDEVVRLVLLTVAHDPDEGDANGSALCDADLAILASSPERYRSYVAGVRAEYAQFSDVDFARGRLAVLSALDDGPLFRTPHARAHWEPVARRNLAEEMQELRVAAEA